MREGYRVTIQNGKKPPANLALWCSAILTGQSVATVVPHAAITVGTKSIVDVFCLDWSPCITWIQLNPKCLLMNFVPSGCAPSSRRPRTRTPPSPSRTSSTWPQVRNLCSPFWLMHKAHFRVRIPQGVSTLLRFTDSYSYSPTFATAYFPLALTLLWSSFNIKYQI